MQWTESIAEKRLSDMKMPDMPVVPIVPKQYPVASDWFKKYKESQRTFIKSLSDCVQELALMNLSRDEFMNLLMGREIPDNLSIRLRTPLIWGGRPEPENMFMCFTFPVSQNLDRFILEQQGNGTVWLPNPAKKIYLTGHSVIGGNGGNATPDRLTQFAATMANNRRNP